jgi:hypothetical protein
MWKKRLFGLRGGARAVEQEEAEDFDRARLFGPPLASPAGTD